LNHSFSDQPSKSSSSEFSATSAADFHYRRVLSSVENLCSAFAEVRAWQQAWQPVIASVVELQRLLSRRETQNLYANERLQAQLRDYDLALETVLLEIEALKSSPDKGTEPAPASNRRRLRLA
jgi:hypothetical protein